MNFKKFKDKPIIEKVVYILGEATIILLLLWLIKILIIGILI
jgi:hypothetical protein